jgi:hypothetical protein
MLNPEPAGGDVSASFGQPLGQVVSVRGSRARLGLLIPPIEDLDAIRATVGKFRISAYRSDHQRVDRGTRMREGAGLPVDRGS